MDLLDFDRELRAKNTSYCPHGRFYATYARIGPMLAFPANPSFFPVWVQSTAHRLSNSPLINGLHEQGLDPCFLYAIR